MLLKIFLIFTFIHFKLVLSHKKSNDYYHIYNRSDIYFGEKFPEKFFSKDIVKPTGEDFTYYVRTLSRVIEYFASQPNETDPNIAIGSYLMKAILKRTLIDYSDKMNIEERSIIKDMVSKAEYIVSHFVTDCLRYSSLDLGHGLSKLFRYDESLVYSIGKFNSYVIQKWLTSDVHLNVYAEEFDTLALPKEKYLEYVVDMDLLYQVSDSDFCLSRLSTLHMPISKGASMAPCRRDSYCIKKVLQMPSVAYALSHRLLYVLLVDLTRRCYLISEEVDRTHMDIMCASMYRETVYMARRGYFYRDLFMEHVALCAFLGYEEFHRNNWFKKTASWIDEDGCMEEFRNFEVNRTRLYVSRANNSRAAKTIRRLRNVHVNEECSHHQMALAMNVLAHGIRYSAHYMKSIF